MTPFSTGAPGVVDASDQMLYAALEQLDYTFDSQRNRFSISIPALANIATDTVGVHARGPRADAVAIRFVEGEGEDVVDISFMALDQASTQLAKVLQWYGVSQGDVVAVHTGARIETVIAHLAVYKLGAIAATLSQLYGQETVLHILIDSGAVVLITQESVWRPVSAVRNRCPALRQVLVAGAADLGTLAPDETPFEHYRAMAVSDMAAVVTRAEDPALLVYTSGSTGQPKGVLHAHRILHAYKPTLELFNNLELREPDLVLWTAADWAWVGGLIDIVYPALLFGQRLLATQHRFEPEWALGFMARHGVTHVLLTPTALNRLAHLERPRERWPQLALRTVFTGGEPLPGATLRWLHEELGVVCNEGYGMSEVNHMIGNCQRLRPIRPGSMGWEFPGHIAALVDDTGAIVPDGEVGEIVTTPDAPTLFLGYWKRPDLTAAMCLGPWIRTRDLAVRDTDGYYWYRGRDDDLIKSSGYRIGPIEIEEVLSRHPAVVQCAVIGVPDAERGQIVRAYVELVADVVGDDALSSALCAQVRQSLGPYKVPRQLLFVGELPLTSTGKVSRADLRRTAAGRNTQDGWSAAIPIVSGASPAYKTTPDAGWIAVDVT